MSGKYVCQTWEYDSRILRLIQADTDWTFATSLPNTRRCRCHRPPVWRRPWVFCNEDQYEL